MKFDTKIIEQDTKEIVKSEYIDWHALKNKTILITGATGLIGSQIINACLYANEILNVDIKIVALARNRGKCEKLFNKNKTDKITYLVQDINEPINYKESVDYIIHTANSTSSKSFVETPVETIDTILDGTKNVLDFGKRVSIKGVVYLSSMEVYGQTDFNRVEPLKERDLGYIDLYSERSSYPEAKRMAEMMCYAYAKEYDIPIKIARLVQTIGANVDYKDNRVFAQFARSVIERKDIVLKTDGKTIRSYCYITDVITAIFSILQKGVNGECYNVANSETTCSIKEMAELVCKKYPDISLKFELDEANKDGYLPTIKTILDNSKLKTLNWNAEVDLDEMYERLVKNLTCQKEI